MAAALRMLASDLADLREEVGGIHLILCSTECQGISRVNHRRQFVHHSRIQLYQAKNIMCVCLALWANVVGFVLTLRSVP